MADGFTGRPCGVSRGARGEGGRARTCGSNDRGVSRLNRCPPDGPSHVGGLVIRTPKCSTAQDCAVAMPQIQATAPTLSRKNADPCKPSGKDQLLASFFINR